MVKVKCSVPNCQFETDDASEALVIAILANHRLAHLNSQPVSTAQAPVAPRGPKLERPKVDIGVTTEGWNVFVRRWDVFRSGSGIDEASAPSQLFQCAGTELGDSLLKANPKAASDTLPELLAAMRSLAVIPIATGVLRTELLQLQQERDEPFRAFAAKVRGKAETCEFTAECECGKEVDYTNHSIRDVLLNGIYDPDIRREVLGTKNILKTSVNDVIALVENKEMARNALPSSNLSAVSSFQHLKNAPTPSGTQTPSHLLAPFKPFLSPRYKFSWSPDLEEAFQKSKEAIVKAIRQGVEIFDTKKRTCLRPDWSKRGIGYFLLQQHCRCSSGLPDCCPGGWQITLAGSRFLSSAEQRYAAIEGEALAVAWGLEQTKYFTQGCDNLIVVTNHKPLVKIFGDRTLDEISNSRLFRLKQRTLPWRFEMHHLPGKSNSAADATSRHPSPSGSTNGTALESSTIADQVEKALMASISKEAQELGTISWSLIAQETATDTLLSHLLQRIEQGTQHFDRNDPAITPLWPICESAYVQEGVLLYQDRVVVPSSLRHRVLQHLHAAHQGTSSMEQRARAIVYWPGMSKDIRETRERCADCNRNAPSQPATPPTPSAPPSTPFEAVFADFFNHGGHHYLVVGDRLSGWVEVFGSAAGTNLAGAAGLMSHLRSFFATFGVPEELSSDGGPEFTAGPTERFLRNWGVRHRLSSAYFPQSNGRAEVAVKTAKRLLMSNTGPTGSLNHDRFLQAMLQLRNTPDPDCNVSPAQIIFGRPLRDTLSFINRLEKFSNPHVRPTWRQAWAAKEDALCTRLTRTTESLKEHSRPLRPLGVGERVFLQNQQGPSPTKWDRSGVVVEAPGHDQYRVKVDGSGRLTLCNRRFLRAYTLANPSIDQRPKAHQPPPFNEANQKQCLPCCPPEPRLQTLTHPTYLQGNSPSLVAPRSTSTGISPLPTTGSPAPSHVPLPNESPETKPMDNEPEVEPSATQVVAPQSPQPSRPSRERRPPKCFEPETGRWL